MYCSKCGEQNSDDSKFCKNCGTALVQEAYSPQQTQEQRPIVVQQVQQTTRTSGLAVASLVLGIIGFFFAPSSILALIFGAVAVSQTGKDPNLGGRGMAIAGLVLGTVIVVLWIIAFVLWGAAFSIFFSEFTSESHWLFTP